MRAVIFDVDGTLLHSNKLDDETYVSAIHDVLHWVCMVKRRARLRYTGAGDSNDERRRV